MADSGYYSINDFPGDGSQTTFEVSFAGGYISRSHISARLFRNTDNTFQDVLFDWINPYTIRVSPAVPVGYTLRMYRQTPINAPLVDYSDGALLSEVNLDVANKQAIFAAAEAVDAFGTVPGNDALRDATAALVFARSRANHTGQQAADTVTGLTAALADGVKKSQNGKDILIVPQNRGQGAFAVPRAVGDGGGQGATMDIRQFCNGPVELENAFDLLNKATGASLVHGGNDVTELARTIHVPMPLVFPGENKSVYVRKGQTLVFEQGRQQNLAATVNNTLPVFDFGKRSDGTQDPGGLPVRIINISTVGGPAGAAVLRASNTVQGYTIIAPFITAAGIGIDTSGSGDGIIDMAQLDLCLNGLIIGGQNNNFGLVNCYNNQYDVQVVSNTFDCGIDFLHSEYAKTASVQIGDGATNIQGFRINTHKGLMNAQYETSQGFLNFRSNGADVAIGNAEYRNGKGAAIRVGSGLNNRLRVGNLFLDQLKTNPVYDQSNSMGAFEWQNGDLFVGNMLAMNLSSQPVLIQGGFRTRASIKNAEFWNCTGGGSEILVTATGAGSSTRMHDVYSTRGDGARYFNSGSGTATLT